MTPTPVVRTYLLISGLFTLSASVIWGVNTLFLLDAGLDIFEVFIVGAAFTAGTVLFEIPTGVVADTTGRRRSFLFQGVFLMWGFYAWQPYLLELWGRNAVWVAGVVTALTALATIAGNGLVEFFTRFCSRRTTLLLAAGGTLALAAAGIGSAQSFWLAVALLLLVNAAHGVALPVQQAYLHDTVASSQRATVASSVSLVNSAGRVGWQLALGHVARAESVAAGYVAGGLATLLVLPPLVLLRRMGQPIDTIAGRKAGARGACAAQRLPAVSAIDTTPWPTTPEPKAASHSY